MTTELVFRDDPYATRCEASVVAVADDGVIMDRTVFYARGGGQPGDRGTLTGADGATYQVSEATKAEGDDVLHLCPGDKPAVGDTVTACIDWDRRHRLMRMHSCLHLLSALVHGQVTGGQVGVDKGRLDFDLPEGGVDKKRLTEDLMGLIAADHPVVAKWVEEAELAANPELVKTMSVAPPPAAGRVRLIDIAGVDLQACGGTHVRRTGEIGRVRVGKIENKGRQNRRVNVLFDD